MIGFWIAKTTRDQEELANRIQRAMDKVAGVDYREGHFRDNATPDELRVIVLGLAVDNERLRVALDWIAHNAIIHKVGRVARDALRGK